MDLTCLTPRQEQKRLQGYLVHKKQRRPRTLQQDYLPPPNSLAWIGTGLETPEYEALGQLGQDEPASG